MKTKYFKLICNALMLITLAVTAIESQAEVKAKHTEKEIEQLLIDVVNKLNKQLPMTVDKETRVDNTVAYNKTLIYKCTLVDISAKEFNYSEVKKEKEPELINNVCTNKSMNQLLKYGVNIMYVYYDKAGKELIRFDINRKKCGK